MILSNFLQLQMLQLIIQKDTSKPLMENEYYEKNYLYFKNFYFNTDFLFSFFR